MIGEKENTQTCYDISRLTFREVERELSRLPALILPLGGCEPYGESGALGVASACAGSLGMALSDRRRMLLAPTLGYGCSTPYGAFGGCAGVKPRTQTNILCETVRRWRRQGFEAIVLIDALYDNSEAVDLAVQRLKVSDPDLAVVVFSLQRDKRVRAFVGRQVQGKEPGRTEYGLLSLAAFVDPGLVRKIDNSDIARPQPDAERYRTWRKRGADPQQYRKLFPTASASGERNRFDADFGRELFGFILQLLDEAVEPLLQR
jgi:creatinine amidohydrolase/Fe(II)-dependent formamide hydrolase-like protein